MDVARAGGVLDVELTHTARIGKEPAHGRELAGGGATGDHHEVRNVRSGKLNIDLELICSRGLECRRRHLLLGCAGGGSGSGGQDHLVLAIRPRLWRHRHGQREHEQRDDPLSPHTFLLFRTLNCTSAPPTACPLRQASALPKLSLVHRSASVVQRTLRTCENTAVFERCWSTMDELLRVSVLSTVVILTLGNCPPWSYPTRRCVRPDEKSGDDRRGEITARRNRGGSRTPTAFRGARVRRIGQGRPLTVYT